MTELLERAIARVRALPDAMQDDAARMLLVFAGDGAKTVYHLTPEEEAEQDAADAEEARGDYASDEEIRAIWAKHGL
jgi:hypothetical protein